MRRIFIALLLLPFAAHSSLRTKFYAGGEIERSSLEWRPIEFDLGDSIAVLPSSELPPTQYSLKAVYGAKFYWVGMEVFAGVAPPLAELGEQFFVGSEFATYLIKWQEWEVYTSFSAQYNKAGLTFVGEEFEAEVDAGGFSYALGGGVWRNFEKFAVRASLSKSFYYGEAERSALNFKVGGFVSL